MQLYRTEHERVLCRLYRQVDKHDKVHAALQQHKYVEDVSELASNLPADQVPDDVVEREYKVCTEADCCYYVEEAEPARLLL